MGKYEAVTTNPGLVVLDAINRMVRTWWQVVGAGVLVALGDLGITMLTTGDVFSGDFWSGLLKGAITAVLAATFAYWSRFRKPPPPLPETTTVPTAEPNPAADTPSDDGPFTG